MEEIIQKALNEYTDKQLGELLRTCRERALLTQRHMSHKMHFDRTYINKIESGKCSVSSIEIIKPKEFIKSWLLITDQEHYFLAHVSKSDKLMKAVWALAKLEKAREILFSTGGDVA